MMLQLDPPIPVVVVGGPVTGKGYALAWIDYSQEHDLLWVVAFDADGQVWCVPNREIRVAANHSMGRTKQDGPGPGAMEGTPSRGCMG